MDGAWHHPYYTNQQSIEERIPLIQQFQREESFVQVTGGKVWYRRVTNLNKEEGNGTPVVIIHGGPGSSCYSLEGLEELATNRPVILYDQLGCGRSERPTDPSLWKLERFVYELAEIRKALDLEEVNLLGHSWGTTLAAAYSLTKPSGVNSIIFSSPCLSAPLWEQDQRRNLKKLPEDVQDVILASEENGTTDSENYQKATAIFNQHFVCRLNPYPEHLKQGKHLRNPEVYNMMWGPSEFTVTGNLKSFDCTPRLNELNFPTLYTCGRFDEATPETTEHYSRLTPNSQIHIFEQSAHMPYIEEKGEYLRVIQSFLNSVD